MLMNNDKRLDIDLEYGKVFEQKVADMLQNSKIEVKTERDRWSKTGNIVVEFESRGRPSGIATTEADYWFHNLAIGNNIVMTLVFPVYKLRSYIVKHRPKMIRGGDDNTSRMYLISLTDLVTIIE